MKTELEFIVMYIYWFPNLIIYHINNTKNEGRKLIII